MSRVPDRKKLRRDYVRRKIGAYASGTACMVLLLPALLVAIVMWLIAVAIFVAAVVAAFHYPTAILRATTWYGILCYLLYLAICIVPSFLVQVFWEGVMGANQARNLPYVPPVNPYTLPAEETLVRGAEEPATDQSTVLLRGAQAHETSATELLRIAK